jgi:hypothetical protein
MPPQRPGRLLLALLPLLALVACGPAVDIRESVELVETSSGWFDVGIVDGRNKIVPSVSFRLRKSDDVDIERLAVNVIFRRPPLEGEGGEEQWDEVFLHAAAFSEGTQTPLLVVRAEKGYTGDPPQSRLDLLQHREFRDIRAHIYARYRAAEWVQLGTVDVERRLLTR